MNKRILAIPLTLAGIVLFIIIIYVIGNRDLESELEAILASSEPEEVCALHLGLDERWPLLNEFGFTYTIISMELETCGLMGIISTNDGGLSEENLLEFVELIRSFYENSTYTGGFSTEDIYPYLEELGLLEEYLYLLENYD